MMKQRQQMSLKYLADPEKKDADRKDRFARVKPEEPQQLGVNNLINEEKHS